MRQNKKKIFTYIGIFTVVTVLAVPLAVFAYLRSKPDVTHNTVKIEQVKETIEETFPAVEKQVQYNNEFQKEIAVKNNGTAPCFVRVYMQFSDSRIKDISKFSDADEENFRAWDEYINYIKSKNWEYLPESEENGNLGGYFYYKSPLNPEDSTGLLLKKVRTDYLDSEQISEFQIIVYSETVQAVDDQGSIIADCKEAWRQFLR